MSVAVSRVNVCSNRRVGRLDAVQLAAAIADNQAALRRAECRDLELACAWADAHTRYDGVGPGDWSPLIERARYVGGRGTPALEEFCVAELGALHGISTTGAELLLADALDLRHRLPRLVQAGDVRAWQARKVAQATRPLAWDAYAANPPPPASRTTTTRPMSTTTGRWT